MKSTGESPPTRPLRVALVLKTAQGGMWTAPHVDELRARGHEVVAVLPPGEGGLRRMLSEHGARVVDSTFSFRFRPTPRTVGELLALRRQLAALAPDVVHYHLYASALSARLATAGSGVPRVYMITGGLYLESWLIRAAERLLCRLDTMTISGCGEAVARRYRGFGMPVERTRVIPYGVDTRRFLPQDPSVRDRTRRSLGIGPDDFVAIMVAFVYAPKRMVHEGRGIKGHDVLLEAWPRFRAAHPATRLLLVGGGFGERGEVHRQELIARFRLDREDSGVVWVESTDDVRPYYAAADVSVSPSLSEGHGAALEAGAMGVPSVVSDVGGLPAAVGGKSSWIVRPDDPDALAGALREAHAEHTAGRLRHRSSDVRARVVRHFDSGRAAVRVADVIEEAANAGERRGPGDRLVALFGEFRFGRDALGRCASPDQATAAWVWERYTRVGDRLNIVARTSDEPDGARCAVEGVGTAVRPLPDYRGVIGLLRTLPSLVRAVTREVAGADVVVLRLPGAIGSIAGAVCAVLRRGYAVEVVGDPFDVLTSGTLGWAGRATAGLARAQMRRVVRRASAVLYVTNSTLQRRYPASPGRPVVGVSSVDIGPGSLSERPRSWSGGTFHVIAVGSQEQDYKGHDVLIRALRRLVDSGLDARAVLVGGGRLHDGLVALAESLGLADRIRFTGILDDRRRLVELLDEADLFAMPSRAEGLPRALVEAMARGLPAVGTRVGGIPELLEPGCLVGRDDEEALARVMGDLLTDPEEWERQSRRNLTVAATFEATVLDERFTAWLAEVPHSRSGVRS
ncbi:MAG TPA: glycosyltransferase family 4 protein [Umezawaea sp.]|nr:glycosyltransferase family 4 protein [Umezawaea sp.]